MSTYFSTKLVHTTQSFTFFAILLFQPSTRDIFHAWTLKTFIRPSTHPGTLDLLINVTKLQNVSHGSNCALTSQEGSQSALVGGK